VETLAEPMDPLAHDTRGVSRKIVESWLGLA
jgi:hypothetical protein